MPNNDRLKIMVVDRDLEIFRQTQRIFPRDAAHIWGDRTLEHAFEKFEEHTFDILMLTGAAFKYHIDSTIELLEIIATKCPITQVLIFVHPKELALAFSALKAGSFQYAKLPVADEELRLEFAAQRQSGKRGI
jgi:DNA-binding NtrC family response regulator